MAGGGSAAGTSFDIGNGFTAALGYRNGTTEGLLTKEGLDTYGGQLTYTADSYGASVTANVKVQTTLHTGDLMDTGLQPRQELLFLQSVLDTKWRSYNCCRYRAMVRWTSGMKWDQELLVLLLVQTVPSQKGTDYYMYEAFYSYPVNDGMIHL